MMGQIWDFLSTEGFQPHGVCLLWRPDVFWAHVISDLVIALSYFSIPAALLYLVGRRADLMYRWVFYLFGAFIVACGLTHLFGIWTLWVPDYGMEAILKVATALVSLVTAISLWPLMPKLLALPSSKQLAEKNDALAHEVAERQSAQQRLKALNEDLERRVAERTESLERANQALVESRALAERANRAKSDFLAMMSHELRTPLNAIIGFSDALKPEHKARVPAEKTEHYADYIHESGQHLLDLINDILDLSKVESGADRLSEECIDLKQVLPTVLHLTSSLAEKAGVTIRLDVADAAPRLRADQRKLKQILTNLLSNAIKFTPSGGEVLLRARAVPDEGYVFQVIDNGVGMAPEDIPRAFTPFQQLDVSRARPHEGTGLGLPLTKGLVELHGGRLKLESRPGQGTTVTVAFPAARIATPISPASAGLPETSAQSPLCSLAAAED